MLNLMKYEARRALPVTGIILGAFMILLAAFFGFYWKGVEVGTIMFATVLGFVGIVTILFFVPIMFLLIFDKDINTRQGYLLCLVPQKSTTILISKLLVSLIQSTVLYTIFFTVVPFCEKLCENKFGVNPGVVGVLVGDMSLALSGATDIIEFWAVLLTLWLFFACLGMFVTAIPGKGKLASLFCFILFFAAIFLMFFLLEKLDWLFDTLKTPVLVGDIAEWVYIIGIDAVLFLGTAKLMDKKVSL